LSASSAIDVAGEAEALPGT